MDLKGPTDAKNVSFKVWPKCAQPLFPGHHLDLERKGTSLWWRGLMLIFCTHKSKASAKIECANFSASPADCLIRTSYSLREVQRNKFYLWHKRYYCCGIETYSNGFVYSYVHNWPGKLWQQTRFMFSQITLNCKITKLARIWRNSHTYTFSSKNNFFFSKTPVYSTVQCTQYSVLVHTMYM